MPLAAKNPRFSEFSEKQHIFFDRKQLHTSVGFTDASRVSGLLYSLLYVGGYAT
jgi:hypothetical protein